MSRFPKRKGKRVKKELRTATTQTIDDLFEKFYHAKLLKGELNVPYINTRRTFVTLRIFSTTKLSVET
ncbi:hypothetical protein [Ectobacillus sp. sgz5001026]|uniref:hypothetical protein n=1 Tax=Ectobacillus sp. sgz5001026 TaxID=3242473 RepID=UPI0036D39F13